MIRFLIDSAALWRVLREDRLRTAWSDVITAGAVGSCQPQRVEFRRSARDLDEYDQMADMFDALYPDVPVPKTAWRWIESAQYRLVRAGCHRALSAVDLLQCAVASYHGLVVLHDDNDFATVARHVTDLRERRIQHLPARER